jgi:hypothetical protein
MITKSDDVSVIKMVSAGHASSQVLSPLFEIVYQNYITAVAYGDKPW